jgi:hypothetical protein
VIVFVDYQNVIKRAYAYYAKNLDKPNIVSQINPSKLGDLLMRKYTDTRELKHGKASEVKVSVEQNSPKTILLKVQDNGKKIAEKSTRGLGTKLLEECAISWKREKANNLVTTSAEFAISA